MRRKKGFTLIELLVVIAIIAVLAMVGGAAYMSSMKRGRNARRAADIQQIRSALEMARTTDGYYPKEGAAACDSSRGTDPTACSNASAGNWNITTGVMSVLKDTYLNALPKDPLNNSNYYYNYQSLPTTCNNTTATKCMQYELLYYEEPLTGSTPILVTVKNP